MIKTLLFTIVLMLTLAGGCFPSKKAVRLDPPKIDETAVAVEAPTKVVLTDATILLFPKGFTLRQGSIQGIAQQFSLTSFDSGLAQVSVSIDKIAAMTKYEWGSNVGHGIASLLHGLLGATMGPISVYCLICPKCCFGSCPTVYTFNGETHRLEAELFSRCISKQLEENDADLLTQPADSDGRFAIRITNEALETHYINRLTMKAVYYPIGTSLYLTNRGQPISIGSLRPPVQARTRTGADILELIGHADDRAYRSGDVMVGNLLHGDPFDWIDVTATFPQGVTKTSMVLTIRNTLLSTVLLYDVVLASQGIKALTWIERMDSDPDYAQQFRHLYRQFSGVTIQVFNEEGGWEEYGVEDAGPLAWKSTAIEMPVGESGSLRLRLRFVSDNVMIDKIGFSDDNISTSVIDQVLDPLEVRDHQAKQRPDAISAMERADGNYLVTQPGDWYDLEYAVPEKPNTSVSMLLESQGYYHEWVRGQWIQQPSPLAPFDLSEPGSTFISLARSWLKSRQEMESRFFETRIPLRRGR